MTVLTITGNADLAGVAVQYQVAGVAQVMTAPVMEIHRDAAAGSSLLARLDTSGGPLSVAHGSITGSGTTTLSLAMPASETAKLAALCGAMRVPRLGGNGPDFLAWYDIFATVGGKQLAVASMSQVRIIPNVTGSS